MPNQKGFSPLVLILIIAILVLLSGFAYVKLIKNESAAPLPADTPKVVETTAESKEKMAFVERFKVGEVESGRLVLMDRSNIKSKIVKDKVSEVYDWSFDNKYLALRTYENAQLAGDTGFTSLTGLAYGLLDVNSNQIIKLPVSDVKGGFVGWTSENNLLFLDSNPNDSGNQDFLVYSIKGELIKKFTLVTPKSKDNNAYFDHHITHNGKWLVYRASGVGVGDGIEVIDTRQYIYNLERYELENSAFVDWKEDKIAESPDQIIPGNPVPKVNDKYIQYIESKSNSSFGFLEHAPEPYGNGIGIYKYEIYKENSGKMGDQPKVTLTFDRQAITQALRILSVSPDGKYIAYTKDDHDTRYTSHGLYIMNLDTSDEQLISNEASDIKWTNVNPN